MRLLLVVPGFSAGEADWCVPCLHHLVRRLARDHEVRVLALRHPPRRTEYPFFNARVRSFAAGRRTGVARLILIARALADVQCTHRRTPLDVIHGLWADEPGFIATRAGQKLGVRSVVSVMGGELVGLADIGYGVQLGRTGRWLVRRSLGGAAAVTVGSEHLAERLRRMAAAATPVRVPLGVDTGLFTPCGEAAPLEGDPCLLSVAALSPVKGHRLLLEAFATLLPSHPRAHLHLVGEGQVGPLLEQEIRDRTLGASVTLHGAVAHHLLPPFYRRAALHVVSSRFESQCMAAVEAAACGTPSAGAAVGILPEMGMPLAAEPTAAGLAAALRFALAGRDRTRALAASGLDWVAREGSLERSVARLVALYDRPAGPSGASRR